MFWVCVGRGVCVCVRGCVCVCVRVGGGVGEGGGVTLSTVTPNNARAPSIPIPTVPRTAPGLQSAPLRFAG